LSQNQTIQTMKALSASPRRATIQRSEGMVIGAAAGGETGAVEAAAALLAMSSFTSSSAFFAEPSCGSSFNAASRFSFARSKSRFSR
jgi:hypothetical protein